MQKTQDGLGWRLPITWHYCVEVRPREVRLYRGGHLVKVRTYVEGDHVEEPKEYLGVVGVQVRRADGSVARSVEVALDMAQVHEYMPGRGRTWVFQAAVEDGRSILRTWASENRRRALRLPDSEAAPVLEEAERLEAAAEMPRAEAREFCLAEAGRAKGAGDRNRQENFLLAAACFRP